MQREEPGGVYYTAHQGARNCDRMVPGSGLCLNTGVGCVAPVRICGYSHHLIKSHTASVLSPVKVADCTSNLLSARFLVASSTTRNVCPLMTRQACTSTPSSQKLCVNLCWTGGAAWPYWPTSAAPSVVSQAEKASQGAGDLLAVRKSSNSVNCGHWKQYVSHHVCHNGYTF